MITAFLALAGVQIVLFALLFGTAYLDRAGTEDPAA